MLVGGIGFGLSLGRGVVSLGLGAFVLRWDDVFVGVLVGSCWVGFGVVCWIGASLKTTIHYFFIQHRAYFVCLFVLRFYGPVNPMGSCRARSVYLTTRIMCRLSPLSG